MSGSEKIRNLESNPPIEHQGNMIRFGKIGDSQSGTWRWFRWTSDNVSIDCDLTVPAQTGLISRSGAGDQSIKLAPPVAAIDALGERSVKASMGQVFIGWGTEESHLRGVGCEFDRFTSSSSFFVPGGGNLFAVPRLP
jgi:hypothetical protein